MQDVDNAPVLNIPQPAAAPDPGYTKKGDSVRVVSAAVILILGAIVGFGLGWFVLSLRDREVAFPTPYQTVLLSNGAVYYGKLEGYGTAHPVLMDVFYIVTQTDQQTKQSSNVLVKRGRELHGPDRMYLNPNLIVFVEPVGQSSKVAQLIAASH